MSVSELSVRWSPEVLALLIRAGARIDGKTLRYMSKATQNRNPELSKVLVGSLEAVSMENLLDEDRALYTELLVSGPMTPKILQDIAEYAPISKTGHRNRRDYWPALRRAVEYNNLEATKALISLYNIDTNQKCNDERHEAIGATILHLAAASSSPKVIEHLLQCGADPQHTTEDGRIPLHFCAYGIDGLACRLLLQRGSDIAKTDQRGWSPWHFASALCNPSMAEALAEHDPDVKSSMARPSVDGCAPIHVLGQLLDAVEPNDLPAAETLEQRCMDMMLVLCKYGANPCIRSKDGSTALHHWALRRHSYSKIAKQLLEEGDDPCAVRNDGKTPLHLLVTKKHLPIRGEKLFREQLDLLGSEATLNALDKYGSSPLHLFCGTFPLIDIYWDPVGYRMLVSRGADPMLKDGRGRSCFDIASDAIRHEMKSPTPAWHKLQGAAMLLLNILDSVPGVLRSLLRHSAFILRFALGLNQDWFTMRVVEKGFDLNSRDKRGNGDNYSALEYACFTPISAISMKLILDRADDVGGLVGGGPHGYRLGLLHLACLRSQDQNIQVLNALLDYGLDPDIRCSPEEMTPLMFAASRGKLAHARSLLDRGADPQAMSGQDFNWNAAHFACVNGHLVILELLLDCHKQTSDQRMLLSVKVAGRKEHDRANMLHSAAFQGKHEVIRYLLSTCTISNVDCRSELGRTPLHYAVRQGHIDSVLVLLSSGADVNASEPRTGYSILHWAARNGHLNIVQMLLTRNCNASAVSQIGLSPHVLAIRGGHKDVAQCIKDHILQKGEKCAKHLHSKKSVDVYREVPIIYKLHSLFRYLSHR
jgi:cytohesin